MWRRGNIELNGEGDFLGFDYVKQPHTAEEDKMWKAAGYNHDSYTGKMYGYPNQMPEYAHDYASRLGITLCGFNFYRMDHMDMMPPHTDHFQTYMKKFPVDREKIVRAVIFLQDAAVGHYFEIGGQVYKDYKAGDFFVWDYTEEHAAGNYGFDPRFTLQITGMTNEVYEEEEYKQGIFWSGFEEHDDFLGFIGKYLESNYRFLTYSDRPYFVYTGVGEFELPFIPKENFVVYLYEPLTLYVEGEPLNMGFYHEPTPEQYDKVRAFELDSLSSVELDAGVNMAVKTCDYKVKKHFKKIYPNLNLETEDIYIRQISPHKHINSEDVSRVKKFICPNWRYTLHRHIVMSYLAKKDGNYSWYISASNSLDKTSWVDFTEFSSKIREQVIEGEKFLRTNYFLLDKTQAPVPHNGFESAWPSGHYGITGEYVDMMRECFVAVVNETRFSQMTGNISEKFIDAVKVECAIVLVAPPFSLEYARKLGFKTFSDFWDESYDMEIDPMKRISKVLETLEYIDSLDLPDLYQKMKPILEHNLQHLLTLKHYINKV